MSFRTVSPVTSAASLSLFMLYPLHSRKHNTANRMRQNYLLEYWHTYWAGSQTRVSFRVVGKQELMFFLQLPDSP